MAAMLVFWIALGVIVGLAIAKLLADRDLGLADAAAAGGLGAFLTGALFALIAGRGDWFDLLSTVVALVGAAVFVIVLSTIESGRERRVGGTGPPRPAR